MTFNPFPALIAAVLCAAAGSASAHGSAIGFLMLRAEVRPSAVLKFEVQSPQLKISDADIEIGFIDIAAGTLFKMSAGRLRPVITLEFPGDAAGRSVELRAQAGSYRLNLADFLGELTGPDGMRASDVRHRGPLSLTVSF